MARITQMLKKVLALAVPCNPRLSAIEEVVRRVDLLMCEQTRRADQVSTTLASEAAATKRAISTEPVVPYRRGRRAPV